jgi:hypothetical protein
METGSVSETLYSLLFLEYRAMDKVQNPVIMTAMHHRQNPLESTRAGMCTQVNLIVVIKIYDN